MASLCHSATTRAVPAEVWAWYADVTRWPQYEGGIRSVRLHGPFASGTRGRVVLANGASAGLRLKDVHEDSGFTDVQRLRGVTVTTEHRLDVVGGATRITHTVTVGGVFGRLFPRLTLVPVRAALPATVARLASLADDDAPTA